MTAFETVPHWRGSGSLNDVRIATPAAAPRSSGAPSTFALTAGTRLPKLARERCARARADTAAGDRRRGRRPDRAPPASGRFPRLHDVELAPGGMDAHAEPGGIAVPEDRVLASGSSPPTIRLVGLRVLRFGIGNRSIKG